LIIGHVTRAEVPYYKYQKRSSLKKRPKKTLCDR